VFVDEELKNIDRKQRDDLLHYRNQGRQTTRALPNVGGILRRHLSTLYRSDEIKHVFPLVVFRRDSNLQDILVHKKHNQQFFNQSNYCVPCGAKRCIVCPYIVAADTFTSSEGVTAVAH